jgi:acyl-coenzyme A synthetase/AMP-(fatty) acid ligase
MNCVQAFFDNPILKTDQDAIIFYKNTKSLTDAKTRVSFYGLHSLIKKAQHYFIENNYKKGDTILLFESPTPTLYATIIAGLALGIRFLVIEPWMNRHGFNSILSNHKTKAIMTNQLGKLVLFKSKSARQIPTFNSKNIQNSQKVESIKIIDIDHDDPALMTFTSGSSGNPKGVVRSHSFLIEQRNVISKQIQYSDESSMDLTVFTNMVLLNLTLGRGSFIVPHHWNKKTLFEIDKLSNEFNFDVLACGPEFLKRMTKYTKSLNPRTVYIGGALCDIALYEHAIKRFQKTQFFHVYGSTEAEPVTVTSLEEAILRSKEHNYFQVLYLGKPIDEIQTKLKDGILWVNGPHVSSLYLNDEASNKKNKEIDSEGRVWHNMGDRVEIINNELWYKGRDFQTLDEFHQEQKNYTEKQSSKSFILNGVIYGEGFTPRKIIRDTRHRSRIDREKSFYNGVPMKNILTFIRERVPIIANLILAFGMVLSCFYLIDAPIESIKLAFAVFALLIFITELRFMDELKDFEKDKVAHPERPLPRGLVTTKQVSTLILIFFIGLIAASAIALFFFNTIAGILFGIVTGWLYLMYKEFFIPSLSKSPLLYAITHQIIIVPVVMFVVALINPSIIFSTKVITFSFLILSAFFSFEVGRKMDPNAHQILGTYLVHYKKKKTNLMILFLQVIGLVSGVILGLDYWVLIPFLLTVITQLRVLRKAEIFKDLEGIIALNLIYTMWVVTIFKMVN